MTTKLTTQQFDYDLPSHLIAHTPASPRHSSRLLCLDPDSGKICHQKFSELPSLLDPKNSVLVFNNTKVIKARLMGHKVSGAAIECVLSHPMSESSGAGTDIDWLALIKPSKRLKIGDSVQISPTLSYTLIRKNVTDSLHHIQFNSPNDVMDEIEVHGHVPLPPYISAQHSQDQLAASYQTRYAQHPGAVAAPTAGLHFSDRVMEELTTMGIPMEYVTLHVGYGTFKPIQSDYISDHIMHEERFIISPKTAKALSQHHRNGKHIIAVGTTSARALESAFHSGEFQPGHQRTSIFIYPGYVFKVVSGLITNFHLPKSSLLLLVSALATQAHIMSAYDAAIANQYRFYSFGDAMFIQPKQL